MPAPKNNKTILVAPLDWGLGHATRCIPVIRQLLQQGCTVIIAASGKQASLLQQEFPAITIVPLQGYNIRYGNSNLIFQLLRQLPRFVSTITKEHQWLQAAINEYGIDGVISDNRYGLYSSRIPCVFITHQLQVQAPRWLKWTEWFAQQRIYRFIKKFGECWIPDKPDFMDSLGKALSHPDKKLSIPTKYIGWLSRFQPQPPQPHKKYQLLISLSGPEPQRTILENILLKQLPAIKGRVLLVRGLPGNMDLPIQQLPHVEVMNHLPGNAMQHAIAETEIFLSRCGYSTLMDLQTDSCRCIFVPTPGQTEQEYLSKQIAASGKADVRQQHNFNLLQAVEQATSIQSFSTGQYENDDLTTTIREWLAMLG